MNETQFRCNDECGFILTYCSRSTHRVRYTQYRFPSEIVRKKRATYHNKTYAYSCIPIYNLNIANYPLVKHSCTIEPIFPKWVGVGSSRKSL